MNCGAFEPLVALYVEGDLPGQDTPRVEAHLAACAGCRELLEDLQASRGGLKNWQGRSGRWVRCSPRCAPVFGRRSTTGEGCYGRGWRPRRPRWLCWQCSGRVATRGGQSAPCHDRAGTQRILAWRPPWFPSIARAGVQGRE